MTALAPLALPGAALAVLALAAVLRPLASFCRRRHLLRVLLRSASQGDPAARETLRHISA